MRALIIRPIGAGMFAGVVIVQGREIRGVANGREAIAEWCGMMLREAPVTDAQYFTENGASNV